MHFLINFAHDFKTIIHRTNVWYFPLNINKNKLQY